MHALKVGAAAVVAVVALHAAAAAPPDRPPGAVLAPKGAGFSATFPAAPKATDKAVELPDGGEIKMRAYVHEPAGTGLTLAVVYAELPDGAADDEDGTLDGAVDGFARAIGADPPEAKAVVLNGHPGRAFEVRVEGKGVCRARLYLANGRLYQVIAAGPDGKTADADAARFFRAFKLTGPAGSRGD